MTPLTEPPVAGNEIDTLIGALERQRRTFAWKAGGLDSEALNTTVGRSSITLGGLLKHLSLVEEYHFSKRLHGNEMSEPWHAGNWDENPDWDWTSAAYDDPADLYELWNTSVERSRTLIDQAIAGGGLDQLLDETYPDGSSPSLRRVMIDIIEEYARHVGHADLIRESIDGLVGEDPPD